MPFLESSAQLKINFFCNYKQQFYRINSPSWCSIDNMSEVIIACYECGKGGNVLKLCECQANAAEVCGVCDVKLTKGRFELEQWQWKDEKERRCKQYSQKMEDEIKSIVIGIAEEKIPDEDLFKQPPLNEECPIC